MANPPRFDEQDSETAGLTNDYDDSASLGSGSYAGRPSTSFDREEQDLDLEDGLVGKRTWSNSFWDKMTIRSRSVFKGSLDKGRSDGLIRETFSRPTRRKTSWYNCCIFGGISGLSILYDLRSLDYSSANLKQSYSPRPQPPPYRRYILLVIRYRFSITKLGETWLGHRRFGVVPYRLHTRCPSNPMPLAQRLLATRSPLLGAAGWLYRRGVRCLAIRQ